MKKALTIILTIIGGLLANIIAAVFPVWALLASDNIVFVVLVGLPIACGLAVRLNRVGKKLEENCGLKRQYSCLSRRRRLSFLWRRCLFKTPWSFKTIILAR